MSNLKLSTVPFEGLPAEPALMSATGSGPAALVIECVTGEDLRSNTWLQTDLALLAAPSDEDMRTFLGRELAQCTHLYVARDRDGRLAGFLTSTRERLGCEPGQPLVHLGWAVARRDVDNFGMTLALFEHFIADVERWERELRRRALLWTTTVSPMVCLGASRLLGHVEPRPDGSYSPEGARLARLLRGLSDASAEPGGNHLVTIRAVARGSRHSPVERARIARLPSRRGCDLFNRPTIEQQREDQLLLIARAPADIGMALSHATTLGLARSCARVRRSA